MATLTLRPNADGALTELDPSSGARWDCVDEDPASDSDYVGKGAPSSNLIKRNSFALPNHSSEAGTINSVKIYARMRSNGNVNCRWRLGVHNGSVYSECSDQTLTSSFAPYSITWANNPNNSNQAWTWSDIDSLQALVYFHIPYAGWCGCSQIYVEVDYTLPLTYSSGLGRGILRGVFG
jgi:hypothetical protein